MNSPIKADRKWNQRGNAPEANPRHPQPMFQLLFERSADAIFLLDTKNTVFVDCNAAAVAMMRCENKAQLLSVHPATLSAETQPDGTPSVTKTAEMIALALKQGSHRFEWVARRFTGEEFFVEVVLTPIQVGDQPLVATVCREITERKRMDAEVRKLNASLEHRISERTAELAASEARARTLVEHAPEAIVVFDGDTGRFRVCNENAMRLYGFSEDELLRRGPADVSPEFQPDGRASAVAAREKIQEALEGKAPVFEWMHRHSSGRLVPCEVRLVRLPSEGLRLVRGSVIDNTERRRREKIQQATYGISEAVHTAENLENLYERIHGIVKELMPAENFYIALFDPENELISFPYYVDQISPQPVPFKPSTGLTGYVLRTGKPLMMDRSMSARKERIGDRVTFRGFPEISYTEAGTPAAIWLGVPLSVHGKPLGVMAVQDYENDKAYGEEEKQILTFVAGQIALAIERKRAGQALQESEQKFRALFEASSQGVMLHDEERFLEVNPATLRIMGLEHPRDVLGKHPKDMSPPTQPDGERSDAAARRHIDECMEKGNARFDWVTLNARGEVVPLEVILTRVELGGRKIIQAVINDISERKKAEAELLKALAREKELGQLKSNFVSMVSHEFRTPLGVIMSSADILDDYFDRLDPDERKRHLQSIHKNTRRMAELMEEVLLIGRLDAGKLDFQPAPLDLRISCQRLTDEILAATGAPCPIHLEVGALPPEANADDRLLRHIFANLLTNAIKYSEPGKPVQFRIERDGRDAVCVIRDRGIGIPEPDQEWLFNAFHRARNVGHRPGTGLGLVIVKRCVELHGGRISVESKVGDGTTVTVRLPVFI